MVSIDNTSTHGGVLHPCKHLQEGINHFEYHSILWRYHGAIPCYSQKFITSVHLSMNFLMKNLQLYSYRVFSTKFSHVFSFFPCFSPKAREPRGAPLCFSPCFVQAVLGEQSKVLCLRFGQDFTPECMKMDEAWPWLRWCRTDTLWLCQNSYWKVPFIVELPIKNGDFP
jgi:hypothetical protein